MNGEHNSEHGEDVTMPVLPPDDVLLRTILEGTAGETGVGFFVALVKNLAEALHAHGAWVTEYIGQTRRLRALAFWLGGQFVPEYVYDIGGTPCESVIGDNRLVHIPDKVVEIYPKDPDLKPVQAVSYLGVFLLDVAGKILGHLAVLDTRPMPEQPRALAVFRIFAARAAAELRRLRVEAQVREREEKTQRTCERGNGCHRRSRLRSERGVDQPGMGESFPLLFP